MQLCNCYKKYLNIFIILFYLLHVKITSLVLYISCIFIYWHKISAKTINKKMHVDWYSLQITSGIVLVENEKQMDYDVLQFKQGINAFIHVIGFNLRSRLKIVHCCLLFKYLLYYIVYIFIFIYSLFKFNICRKEADSF